MVTPTGWGSSSDCTLPLYPLPNPRNLTMDKSVAPTELYFSITMYSQDDWYYSPFETNRLYTTEMGDTRIRRSRKDV